MKIIGKIYFVWFVGITIVWFLLLFPVFFLFLQNKKTYRYAHFVNKIWGVLAYSSALIPWRNVHEDKRPPQAVYVANHFSFIDVPSLFLSIPGFFSIIGKSSLAKVPLFGYMFSRLYIAVNRSVGKKRYEAFEKGLQAVDEGRNLVIFPEGGITSKEPPKMGEFKEGAFKIAIQKNIPIIPVTIYNNWIIMEDKKDKILRWKLSKVKFHSSIETKSLSLDNVQELKDKVFEIISKELELEFSDRV